MPTERLKLTEAACKSAPPNAKLWDTEIKGFGLLHCSPTLDRRTLDISGFVTMTGW